MSPPAAKSRKEGNLERYVRVLMEEATAPVKITNEQGKNYLQYSFYCRNPNCNKHNKSKGNPPLTFHGGFTNAYSHLKCYGEVQEAYEAALGQDDTQASIRLFFHRTKVSTKTKAMNQFLRLVVFKNLPIEACNDPEWRNALKHDINFNKKSFLDMLHELVKIVEKKISDELKDAPMISLLHDGWTKFGVHYFAIFGTFMVGDKLVIRLLGCSTLPAGESDDTEDDDDSDLSEEAVNFTAESHRDAIAQLLSECYDVSVEEKVACQTADSAAVNVKLAELLGVPHLGCYNHKMHNQTENMISEDDSMQGKQFLFYMSFYNFKS